MSRDRAVVIACAIVGATLAAGAVWTIRGSRARPVAAVDRAAESSADGRGGAGSARSTVRPPPSVAVVRAVSGRVASRTRNGPPRTLQAGDTLDIDDVIQTDSTSSAFLGMGGATVTIHPRSRFAVTEVAQSLSRVKLSVGRVSANVPMGGGQQLRVEVPHSDISATSGGGQFSALTDGSGAVAVAANEGTVRLANRSGAVDVPAGQQSLALPGLAPTPPRRIPTSLFLKIGRPPHQLQRESTTVVAGTTNPGAVISVGGKTAQANARGMFTITVPLHEGANTLTAAADDVAGHHRWRRAGHVVVRSTAPPVASRVRW